MFAEELTDLDLVEKKTEDQEKEIHEPGLVEEYEGVCEDCEQTVQTKLCPICKA